MTPLGALSRAFWPIRTAWSVGWASLIKQQVPVPQVRSVDELRAMVLAWQPFYRPDPLGGVIDYSEDPRHVQWCWDGQRMQLLGGFDCDDFALKAKAHTWELDPHGQVWVLISAGPWSHSVYEFRAEGRRWIADTNGVNEIPEGEAVEAFVQRCFYPQAAYEDAYIVGYPFPDPRRI